MVSKQRARSAVAGEGVRSNQASQRFKAAGEIMAESAGEIMGETVAKTMCILAPAAMMVVVTMFMAVTMNERIGVRGADD